MGDKRAARQARLINYMQNVILEDEMITWGAKAQDQKSIARRAKMAPGDANSQRTKLQKRSEHMMKKPKGKGNRSGTDAEIKD